MNQLVTVSLIQLLQCSFALYLVVSGLVIFRALDDAPEDDNKIISLIASTISGLLWGPILLFRIIFGI